LTSQVKYDRIVVETEKILASVEPGNCSTFTWLTTALFLPGKPPALGYLARPNHLPDTLGSLPSRSTPMSMCKAWNHFKFFIEVASVLVNLAALALFIFSLL
jgi:hypothetical protein